MKCHTFSVSFALNESLTESFKTVSLRRNESQSVGQNRRISATAGIGVHIYENK